MSIDEPNYSRLSDKHEAFCREYVRDHNATQAYLRAGYVCTDAAAATAAYKLLRNAEIRSRIIELEADISELTGITLYRIAKELETIAFSPEPRLESKLSAIEKLIKLMGLYKPNRTEVTGHDGGPVKTETGLSENTIQMIRSKILGIKG